MTAALDLIAWLQRSTKPGSAVLRERYNLELDVWLDVVRPDCNAEGVLAFLRAWQITGESGYLTKSRAIWDGFKHLQEAAGPWPMFEGTSGGFQSTHWANDNSETAIFLLRAADADPVNASAYREAALKTLDWFVTQQDVSGAWRACEEAPYLAPWSGAHVCTALSTAYPHGSPAQQSAYLSAITSGLAYIGANVRPDGRILLGYEVHGAEERWRPPSSEQSICVRALAICERVFPTHPDVATWRTKRYALLGWLDPLIDSSGAIRNGYGVGVTAGDVAHITDHVYTTAFAAEAYLLSGQVDGNPTYTSNGRGILRFAAGNIWHSSTNPDEDGCLRGAYDLTAQDFNTSEVSQNGSEEGGGNMAYTGWSAAPVAALLLEHGIDTPVLPRTGRRRVASAAFL